MDGESNGEITWVRFGKARLEVEVAAAVLALMAEREPEHLGAYIGEAMTGTKVKPLRG